jgi:hypothetical protein
MAPPTLLIPTDLAHALIVPADGPAQRWSAPPAREDQPAAALIRDRLDGLVAWLAGQGEAKKRIGAVMVDIDEAECRWISAAGDSPSPAIVASKLRSMTDEWTRLYPVGGVQPLGRANPREQKASGAEDDDAAATRDNAGAQAVLVLPDGGVRLLLDRLDRAGIRVERVTSVWHALAGTIAESSDQSSSTRDGSVGGSARVQNDITAAVLIDPGHRVAWVWRRCGRLVCAGRFALPRISDDVDQQADRIASRLALEWSSWSPPLGAAPTRAAVLGPPETQEAGAGQGDHTERLAAALERRAGGSLRAAASPGDPVMFAQGLASGSLTPAGGLDRLASRPDRAVRRRFMVGSAALLLVAAALAGLGWRAAEAGAERNTLAEQERERMLERVRERAPGIQMPLPGQSVALALEDAISDVGAQAREFEPPPAPRPITEVYADIFRVLEDEQFEGVRVQTINVQQDDRNNTLTLTDVPIGREGTVISAIEGINGPMTWTAPAGAGSAGTLQFRGRWAD